MLGSQWHWSLGLELLWSNERTRRRGVGDGLLDGESIDDFHHGPDGIAAGGSLFDIELAELAKTRIYRRALLSQHGLGSPMSVA